MALKACFKCFNVVDLIHKVSTIYLPFITVMRDYMLFDFTLPDKYVKAK